MSETEIFTLFTFSTNSSIIKGLHTIIRTTIIRELTSRLKGLTHLNRSLVSKLNELIIQVKRGSNCDGENRSRVSFNTYSTMKQSVIIVRILACNRVAQSLKSPSMNFVNLNCKIIQLFNIFISRSTCSDGPRTKLHHTVLSMFFKKRKT